MDFTGFFFPTERSTRLVLDTISNNESSPAIIARIIIDSTIYLTGIGLV